MSNVALSNFNVGKIFSQNSKYHPVTKSNNEKGHMYGLIIGSQSKVILE
jgi:hypothetical protein